MSANIKLLSLCKRLASKMSIDKSYMSMSLLFSISYKGSVSQLNSKLKVLLSLNLEYEKLVSELESLLFDNNNESLKVKFRDLLESRG